MQHDGKSGSGVNKFTIDFDTVLCAWLCAEVRTDLAVDSNATCRNQPITVSSRTDAGSGEKTVQAQGKVTKVTSLGLDVRLRFWQADDFTIFFPLAALLQKLDALEAFQHVSPGGDGACTFQTAVLRHGSVKKLKS
jgi:hypothetical protein